MRKLVLAWVSIGLIGCAAEQPANQDAGGGIDAAPMDAFRPVDSGGPGCADDDDCDDGEHCNGAETCNPAAAEANGRGCIVPDESPCTIGQTCNEDFDRCDTECDVRRDADDDGANAIECGGADCDDSDPNRFPGGFEICDTAGHDEDCDPVTFGVRDADGDGEPDGRCCNTDEAGARNCGSDCDDTRATVNPTTGEICNDRDDDCDELVDEEVRTTYYVDADTDGHGTDDPSVATMSACSQPAGYSTTSDDCDDSLGGVNPGVPDACDAAMVDDDCNGTPNDPPEGCDCVAGTPARPCAGALGICAAGNESCVGGMWDTCSVMGTAESCNGLDDDCDGSVDDGVRVTCYTDEDGDGYAAAGAISTGQCPVSDRPAVGGCPVNFTNRAPMGSAEDCNDGDGGTSPAALEVCDTRDNDCDGTPDDGVGLMCFADNDADTYALLGSTPVPLCPAPGRPEYGSCPFGYTARTPSGVTTADCNDAVAFTRPGAIEACDGIDNDCNGMVDDGMRVTCWADGDDDGYGPTGATMTMECPVSARAAVGGCPMNTTNRDPAVALQVDCNDALAAIRPGAVELCDGIDNDCTGGDDAMRVPCYADADNDTYASAGATSSMQCPDPGRTTVGLCPASFTNRSPAGASDCADANASVNPGMVEMCQVPAFDQNCNGNGDEGYVVCYADTDGDGFSVMGAVPLASACPLIGGYGGCGAGYTTRDPALASNRDCAATDPARHPLASELCGNSVDDNCNGASDEAPALRTLYVDLDGDGGGSGASMLISVSSCSVVPAGWSTNAADCNDRNTVVRYQAAGPYYTTPYAYCDDPQQERCMIATTWYCQVGPTCDAADPVAVMSYNYNCDMAITREPSRTGASCGCYTSSDCAEPNGRCYSGTPACGASIADGATCACTEGDAGCGDGSCGTAVAASTASWRLGCR